MIDKEKVIKWLNVCKTSHYAVGIKEDYPCRLCPYHEKEYCMKELISDALALLKEQEAVEPFHKCIGNEFSLIKDSHYDYCPYCGKPITWEGR